MNYRSCTVTSLMGPIHYARAYSHCGQCHRGCFPPDAEFGLEDRQTAGARDVICLAGVLEPFEEDAHAILPRMSGLSVSPATVQRTTEAAGADVAERRAEGETFGPLAVWDWHRDAAGNCTAYVGLDAVAVLQQGSGAEQAEARMSWVGSVFNPQPEGEKKRQRVWETRYVSGLMSLAEIGAPLRRECLAVGISRADVIVALTDGGNGLEDCLLDAVGGLGPRIEFILDFFHAAEHVQEFAKLWIPAAENRPRQVQTWCHTLKHQGGQTLLAELEALDVSTASAALREAHRQLTGYLRNNLHRTDYPRYRAQGWHIGSGAIESACKTVVGKRLKSGGMRWREYGTTALCHLRALYRSQRHLWTHYWKLRSTA